MNARPIVIAISFAAVYASAQDLNAKITYSGPAASAKKVLAEISKQAGYPFETSPQTANEVLLIQVSGVTLNDLLKRIAQATGAEWSQEANGYRLIRTAALQQTQTRVDVAVRAEQIRAEIARSTARLDKDPKFSSDTAGRITDQAATPVDPASRAIFRLIRTLSPADLAAMAPEARTVYSTRPTAMQRGFRSNVRQILDQLVAEQNIYAQAKSDVPIEKSPDGTIAYSDNRPKPILAPIAKALLIVKRQGSAPQFMIELRAADEQGNIVAQSAAWIGNSGDLSKKTQAGTSEQPIEYSNETKEFAKIIAGNMQSQATGDVMMFLDTNAGQGTFSVTIGGPSLDTTSLSPEWRNKLANPEQFEPLGLISSQPFQATATAKGENMVASFHDRALVAMAHRFSAGTFTPSALLAEAPNLDLRVDEKDGWIVISPAYPSEAYATRLDRAVLGNLLRKCYSAGFVRLDDLAQYMSRQPLLSGFGHFEDRYLALFCPNAPYGFSSIETRLLFRLYATLSTGQRQAALEGTRIPMSTMSSAQAAIVYALVYNSMAGPNIILPQDAQNPGQQYRSTRIFRSIVGDGTNVAMTYSGDKLSNERTEALPNGVPNDGFLALRAEQSYAVLASRSNGGGMRVFTAGDLGGYLASRSSSNLTGLMANQPDFDRFRAARQTRLTLDFQLAPFAFMNRHLDDLTLDAASQLMTYQQLPEDFRIQVEKMKEQIAKGFGNFQFAVPGKLGVGGTPPPSH